MHTWAENDVIFLKNRNIDTKKNQEKFDNAERCAVN